VTFPKYQLTGLNENLLISIANVAPYLKSLTSIAANKLVSLFVSFTHPAFLFANESNHKLLFYLLEAFNDLIQYQFAGKIIDEFLLLSLVFNFSFLVDSNR